MADAFERLENLFSTPAGEDLPPDGPMSDRMDAALQAREQSFRQADDLNWLLEGAGIKEPPAEPETSEAEPSRLRGLAAAVAQDVGMGAVETPRQIVGGMRDAVQAMIDLEAAYTDMGGTLEDALPLGGFQLYDKEGSFSPDYLSPSEWREAKAGGLKEALPPVREPSTMTGSAVRSISQWLRRGR